MTDETQILPGPYFRLAAGIRLNGIYEIEQFITAGGMGEIYKARAIETGDVIAIKTVRPDLAQNAAALSLFRREALALHNLYHEAIVRYFLFSVDPVLNLPYLAMEYVEGESLSEILGRGPVGPAPLRTLLHRLIEGLQAAHRLGIIHRDLSPDNILVPGGDVARAKIIDFGIARSPLGEGTVIGSGFAGKMSYVSPEQLGLFGGEIGPTSDIYSLGLVIAEAASGQKLNMGRSHVEIIDRRRRVPDLTSVDPAFRPLLQRMLQPNPKDRPQSMAEVDSLVPTIQPIGRKIGLMAGITSLVLVVGLGAAGLYFMGWNTAPQMGKDFAGAEPPAVQNPEADRAPSPDMRPDSFNSEPAEPPPAWNGQPSEEKAPISPPPGRLASTDDVREFLRTYSGGQCFYLAPVTIAEREAVIEAFGASPAPFMAFDEAFQNKLGFEPEINLRPITAAQCPIAEFLSSNGAALRGRKPNLTLKSDILHSGSELVATTNAKSDRYVDIFLVSDDGAVHNLANYTKRNGDINSVNLKLIGNNKDRESSPQLLVVVASPKPLAGLLSAMKASSINAERFVRELSEENTAGTVFGLTVKYFKLNKAT